MTEGLSTWYRRGDIIKIATNVLTIFQPEHITFKHLSIVRVDNSVLQNLQCSGNLFTHWLIFPYNTLHIRALKLLPPSFHNSPNVHSIHILPLTHNGTKSGTAQLSASLSVLKDIVSRSQLGFLVARTTYKQWENSSPTHQLPSLRNDY